MNIHDLFVPILDGSLLVTVTPIYQMQYIWYMYTRYCCDLFCWAILSFYVNLRGEVSKMLRRYQCCASMIYYWWWWHIECTLNHDKILNHCGPVTTYIWDNFGSAQVMACCRIASNQYLNKCTYIISGVLWGSLRPISQDIKYTFHGKYSNHCVSKLPMLFVAGWCYVTV